MGEGAIPHHFSLSPYTPFDTCYTAKSSSSLNHPTTILFVSHDENFIKSLREVDSSR